MKGKKILISSILLFSVLSTNVVNADNGSWKKNNVGWWYQISAGEYVKKDWKKINRKWYYFNDSGYMVTGWKKVDGKWYYLKDNGVMASKEWKDDYYLQRDGSMAIDKITSDGYTVGKNGKWDKTKEKIDGSWLGEGSKKWYRNPDGSYPYGEWEYKDKEWYYFDDEGYVVTGWKKIDNTWYYFKDDGVMVTNRWIGSYYLQNDGSMATNKITPDGYTVDENGKWDSSKEQLTGKWIKTNGKWWYRNPDGSYSKDSWQEIDGKWYHFDEDGWMEVDKVIDDYYVGSNGDRLIDTVIPDGRRVGKDGKIIKEEYVEIEDALLLKVINKNIDKNRADDQKITVEEIKNLKELSIFLKEDGTADFSEEAEGSILGKPKSLTGTPDFKFAVTRGIKSIKGLEHAVNLEKLKLNENEIKDITPLKDLTKLKYLELQRNRITDLKPLANLTNLEFLKLYNNLIEDISPLEKLVNLTGLDLHYNVTVEGDENNKKISKGITDISAIKNMTKLEFLDVSENRIKDISPIKDLNKMKDLDFGGNNVSDYTGLADFIVPRYVKQLNEEGGSIGWSSQTIDYGEEISVTEKKFEIDSKFKGIKEISDKLTEAFELEEPLNLFANVESDVQGVTVVFNPENSKFEFSLSDAFIKANNNNKTKVNLKITLEALGWKVKNISLNLNINENPVVVNEKNRDFYFDLFNKSYKGKYTNLTDEANANLQGKAPLKSKDITLEDMKMLKTFKVSNRNIDKNLVEPLKYAENLEEFEVLLNSAEFKREVGEFSFLENAKKLKKFYYSNQDYRNGLEKIEINLDGLSKLSELTDIRVNSTKLQTLEALKNLNLSNLSLEENEITDISVVSNMSNLERLDLENNKITDIKPISKLEKLVTLYLYGNPISDITPLKNNGSIEALLIQKTDVSNIEILKSMPNLHRLRIDGNKKLNDNYMDVVKELKGVNTLFLGKIDTSSFEWFKNYLIREKVEAKFDEDRVRIGKFDEIVFNFEIEKNKIKDGTVKLDNPLKDWSNLSIEQSGDENGENKNENLTFEGDKILVKVSSFEKPLTEEYEIYIIDEKHTFGEYGQPAELSGKVKINLNFIENKEIDTERETGLPRKYDLRNVNGESFVTSVKNQYKNGGCRSFASLGALESHILKKFGKTVDLSENNMEVRHGYYYNNKPSPENARLGRTRESDIGYLISDKGPYLEVDDIYRPFLQPDIEVPNGIDKNEYYKNLKVDDDDEYGPITQPKGVITGKNIPYRVTGFEFLKTVDNKNLISEEDIKLAQIKRAIMDNGAVVTDVYMAHDGQSRFPYINEKYYNPKTFAYYADGKDEKYQNGANHAVTIVGWDDGFSKDNFVTKPSVDGAWIVKDAQGETFGDNGYFYVSFESVSMTQNPYVFTKVVEGSKYSKIYQHDEIPFSGYVKSNNFAPNLGDKSILFNVYKAKTPNERLTDIGFFTTKPNAEYEVYLIPDFKEFKNEAESFEEDYEEFYKNIQKYKVFSGTEEKAGYHVMELEKELNLEQNKEFSIGIWTKNPNDEDSQWDMVVETSKYGTNLSNYGKLSNQLKNETYTFGFNGFIDLNVSPHNEKINASVKGYVRNK